jgi:hypothetical protein
LIDKYETIGMKANAKYIALGWLALGASACFGDSGTPQLLGEWTKVVKIDAHIPKSQDSRTQFDSRDIEFAFTEQKGGSVKGTKTAQNNRESIACKIGDDNRTLVCEDASGVFQGEIYSSDEIVGVYRANGDSSTISTLILRKK